MNWRFWVRTGTNDSTDCAAIEPLLSLYSDGMASAAEVRRVEAHLKDCPECQQALQWMQATHLVIAARPVIPPPADLRARIAQAIAESESGRVPAAPAFRPARRPILRRPALAYGLSFCLAAAVCGVIVLRINHPSHLGPTVAVNPPNNVYNLLPTTPGVKGIVPPVISHTTRPEQIRTANLPTAPHVTSKHVVHHSMVEDEPKMARLPSDDNTNVTSTPSVTKSTAEAVHPPKSIKVVPVRTPSNSTRMAMNHLDRERPIGPTVTPPAPKVSIPNEPSHNDQVATNIPAPHTDVPTTTTPAPQPVVASPIIHHDDPVHVASLSTQDILRETAKHLQDVAIVPHSKVQSGIALAAAGLGSDRSRTLPAVGTGF